MGTYTKRKFEKKASEEKAMLKMEMEIATNKEAYKRSMGAYTKKKFEQQALGDIAFKKYLQSREPK